MLIKYKLILSVLIVLIFCSCSKDQTSKVKSSSDKEIKEEKLRTSGNISNSELSKYDIGSINPRIIELSKELKEISGLTMTPDGRLFAQQDEDGIVYQLNTETGEVIKRFYLGEPPLRKDFEDIAFANNKFYMLHSNGDIYEFSEGNNGEGVNYKLYKTDLSKENDVEGMCFDPETNSLLLITKGKSGTNDSDDKAVYSFSLSDMKFNPEPGFVLKRSEIKNYFNPSGIEYNHLSGTFFVIAANGNEIVEVSKEGIVLGNEKLPGKIHAQPEGITFLQDGTMYISNEGKKGHANLVIYPLIK
ncbi:MAG TPA: SdiA-regulated domain-containing protein [Ignavibacteria bacterium]|nr:SdiA-regulated domain-containing protein [Ignavibacteria bacterium]